MNYRILRVGIFNFELRHRFTSAVTVWKNAQNECVLLANDKDIAAGGQMAGSAGFEATAFHAAITETDAYYEGYAADTQNAVFSDTPVRLDKREWIRARNYMKKRGITEGYVQDLSSAKEEYTPAFDFTGL